MTIYNEWFGLLPCHDANYTVPAWHPPQQDLSDFSAMM